MHKENNEYYKALIKQSREVVKDLRMALECSDGEKRSESRFALESIREEGDLPERITFLEGECEKPVIEVIELKREIASLANLLGDMPSAQEALESILALKPDDLDTLNRSRLYLSCTRGID